MAAVLPATGPLAPASTAVPRPRKRSSSSRTASDTAGAEVSTVNPNVANAAGPSAPANGGSRTSKKRPQASPAASVDGSPADKADTTERTAEGANAAVTSGRTEVARKPLSAIWKVARWPHFLATKKLGQQSTEKGATSAAPQARWKLTPVHPLFSTLLVIAVAGVITSYLVDWSGGLFRGPAPVFGEAEQRDLLAALQKRIQNLDKHVQSALPKLAMQVEVANSRVDKLQFEQTKLSKSMEDHTRAWDAKLDKLTHRLDQIDPFLQNLFKQGGPVLKRELAELVESTVAAMDGQRGAKKAAEASKESSAHPGAPRLTLEDVRVAAREVLETELLRHLADDIAMPDYALGRAGARVLDHSEAVRMKGWGLHGMVGRLLKDRTHPYAQKLLEPSEGVPGNCLPLKGTNGSVDLSLRTTIVPSQITLEHISESVAFEIASAPKKFRVYGWHHPGHRLGQYLDSFSSSSLLGEFSYDIKQRPVQTFRLAGGGEGAQGEEALPAINIVRFEVLTNHGNPSHTCLYRLRVHGTPVA
eukprot:TRINITY_DN3021_c0_g1_i1.p1 TRINITY_DN3021_c0_g1~~TRINITY_DN3021_c0_g1_i1.p1  ORF type:complete len:531 (-),score=86.54 TRINITY_DN3021_c0_g1_i1:1239-2831(-)